MTRKTDDTEVLAFVAEFIDELGYAPTYREIQFACEMSSTSMVGLAIRRLQVEGLLAMEPGMSRTMRPTELGLLTVEERAKTAEEAR